MDLRPEASEAAGTFFLMLAGGAAILQGLGADAVALAFGGVVLVLVYALGPVGGAHFNPAVTLGFAATQRFPWRRVPAYLAAQGLGALAACLLLLPLAPSLAPIVVPTPSLAPALLAEAAGTFLLALVIAAVAKRSDAGLAIGGAVAVAALAFGPFGAGVNPARALAPALVAGAWGGLWPHLVAPAFGGVAGMATWTLLEAWR
ncbi:MAG: aquaporin [Thermoplasmata archaeon]|jgi:glycerol uptake facilitator-like aquaporin|nr:aquaporin [Thermoplasmata archaeon]